MEMFTLTKAEKRIVLNALELYLQRTDAIEFSCVALSWAIPASRWDCETLDKRYADFFGFNGAESCFEKNDPDRVSARAMMLATFAELG